MRRMVFGDGSVKMPDLLFVKCVIRLFWRPEGVLLLLE